MPRQAIFSLSSHSGDIEERTVLEQICPCETTLMRTHHDCRNDSGREQSSTASTEVARRGHGSHISPPFLKYHAPATKMERLSNPLQMSTRKHAFFAEQTVICSCYVNLFLLNFRSNSSQRPLKCRGENNQGTISTLKQFNYGQACRTSDSTSIASNLPTNRRHISPEVQRFRP